MEKLACKLNSKRAEAFNEDDILKKDLNKIINPEVLRMMLDSSYDGLTYTNQDGIIIFNNEAYCRITGINNKQIIGKL